MRPFEKKGGRVVVETKNMWLWKSMCHNMYSYIVKTCRWWIILSLSLSMDLNVLQVHKSRSQRKSTWWIQKFVDNIFISSLSNGWHCFFTRCYVSCTGYGWVNREAILADKDFFSADMFFFPDFWAKIRSNLRKLSKLSKSERHQKTDLWSFALGCPAGT